MNNFITNGGLFLVVVGIVGLVTIAYAVYVYRDQNKIKNDGEKN